MTRDEAIQQLHALVNDVEVERHTILEHARHALTALRAAEMTRDEMAAALQIAANELHAMPMPSIESVTALQHVEAVADALRAAPPAPAPELVALVLEFQSAVKSPMLAPEGSSEYARWQHAKDFWARQDAAYAALLAWTPAALSSPVGEPPANCHHCNEQPPEETPDPSFVASCEGCPYPDTCSWFRRCTFRRRTDRKEPTT